MAAKQGHFKLNKTRNRVPLEYLRITDDHERVQLTTLNDYLNGYTDKLCRGAGHEPGEIKLDQLNY